MGDVLYRVRELPSAIHGVSFTGEIRFPQRTRRGSEDLALDYVTRDPPDAMPIVPEDVHRIEMARLPGHTVVIISPQL